IITWPSAILATIFAVWLLFLQPFWLEQPWMHVKLGFVVLLIIYHLKTHQYFKQLQKDEVKKSSSYMRIWNEGATFILFAVVFLVILKNAINWIYGIIGLVVLGVLIMLGFRVYKNFRTKNPEA
ncbi:MAG: CopD family protein, partial [Flavobacteriales bacterium]|nr:CopD family protein [Flavobacteriales bacterium]